MSTAPSHPPFFFRFRSTKYLLGEFKELEKQEIYLASSKQLNDPVEGYKDVFWLGDPVLWRNLFRHYLLSLVHAIIHVRLIADDQWEEPTIDASLTLDDLPTDQLREMVGKVSEAFFALPSVDSALRALAQLKQPLGPAAVTFCLMNLHPTAMHVATKVLVPYGVVEVAIPEPPSTDKKPDLHDLLEQFNAKDVQADDLEQVCIAAQLARVQLSLIHHYNKRSESGFRRVAYLMTEFPGRYVSQIADALIHPSWFTACFTDDCTNASMWGSYGASHTGVALKFRANQLSNGVPGITLRDPLEQIG